MKMWLKRLWKDSEAQDLTEYALLLVMLSLAAVGALGTLAKAVDGLFENAATTLKNPPAGGGGQAQ